MTQVLTRARLVLLLILALPGHAVALSVGDFNGDGRPDLAVTNQGSESVFVLLRTGNGSFGSAASFAVGSTPVASAVGDFNGDGKLDLALPNAFGDDVSILLGTGSGSFGAATNFAVGRGPVAVAVGDFNGDGKLDLAMPNDFGTDVSILLGTGSGSFGAASTFAVGNAPVAVAVGDFNGDGKLDLAVSNNLGVSILLGTGTGSFGAATDFAVGGGPLAVAVDDFNGDGKPDLAVANAFDADVSILLGTGSGSFGAASTFAVGNDPVAVAVDDFNGDGAPDLAVANLNSDVSVLINSTGNFGLVEEMNCGAPLARQLASGATNSFQFTAAAAGAVSISVSDTSGTIGLLELRLFGPDGGLIADTCTGRIDTPVNAGLHSIGVSDCIGADTGSYTLTLSCGNAGLTNDACGSATTISTTPYADSVGTTSATTEAGDPTPSCGKGTRNKSVWYQFTAPNDGTISADTFGSSYDTVLSVFSGSCGALTGTEVACNDDTGGPQSQVSFPAAAGATYHIMVSAFKDDGGTLVFNLTAQATLSAGSISGQAGQAVAVPITINTGSASVAFFQVLFTVVPQGGAPAITDELTYQAAAGVPAPDLQLVDQAPARLGIGYVGGIDPPLTGTVQVGTLVVPIPAGASGTYQVQVDHVSALDSSEQEVTLTGQNGTITVLTCVGNCGGSGDITVDKLITLVTVALGSSPPGFCVEGDANANGQISIDEIVTAVDNALNGCP